MLQHNSACRWLIFPRPLLAYIAELGLAFYVVHRVYPVPYAFRKMALLLVLILAALGGVAVLGAISEFWSPILRALIVLAFAAAMGLTGILPRSEILEARDRLRLRIARFRRKA